MNKLLSIIILSFIVTCSYAKEPTVIDVSLQLPLVIGTTKTAVATFQNLTDKAIKIGLHSAKLLGSVKYEKLPTNDQRVKIRWHSIEIQKGQSEMIANLSSPLYSQFTTNDKRVEPSTSFKAKGNINLVVNAFQDLKEKSKKDNRARHLVEKTEENNTTVEKDISALSPSSSSGSSGSSVTPAGGSNNEVSANTDLIVSRFEDCPARTDTVNALVYVQERLIKETESGQTIETGNCQDKGNGAPITKEYETCAVIVDQVNRKAFKQYTESADLSGTKFKVSDCTMDPDNYFTIASTYEGCGVRHDFTLQKSIQQEQLYYVAGADRIDVQECQDSIVEYQHYLTINTCSPVIDNANGLVFIQKRTAYNQTDGTISYASDCRPLDNVGVAIQEEICTDKYEHDFIAGQSYLRTKDFYLDSSNTRQYINDCSRSTAASFPHKFETTDCQAEHDDGLLLSNFPSTTFIETPDDGVLEIAPCEKRGGSTTYAFLNTSTNEKTHYSGYGFKNYKDMLSIGGLPSSTVMTTCVHLNGIGGSTIACPTKTSDNPNISGHVNSGLGGATDRGLKIISRLYYTNYLRGDGSTFKRLDNTDYHIKNVQ